MNFKVGDKLKAKDDVYSAYKYQKYNGKEFEVVDIRNNGITILQCDDFIIGYDECDLGFYFELDEYKPKHAKEEMNIVTILPKEMVNHPEHYNQGKYECIDEMIALFGVEAVIWFCKCNIHKYKSRAPYKNGDEDLKKAEWYMDKLLELQGETKWNTKKEIKLNLI